MPDDAIRTIKLFGQEFPIRGWAITVLSGVVCVAVAAWLYYRVQPTDLISLKHANAQLEREMQEYGVHLTDAATSTYVDPGGAFVLKTFPDWCVLIQRRVGGQVHTKIVLDIERTAGPQASVRALSHSFIPTLSAQGRCLNPHPGGFQTAYGNKNGCLVQVYRNFQDGCQHWQTFNACNGSWETNGDGSPRVNWTRCVH